MPQRTFPSGLTAHTDTNMASSSSANLLVSVGSDGGGSVATAAESAAANSNSGNFHPLSDTRDKPGPHHPWNGIGPEGKQALKPAWGRRSGGLELD